MIHGGPTSQARPAFNLATQFWTSRGFAVLDVNYRGSTGYGRTYRMLLNGNWGIIDVEDCVYGVKYLADKGLIDAESKFIRGGSAGGFTVLAALTFHKEFKGGGNYYGVADLTLLAHDTHKFESRYMDGLLGTDPQVWKDRSPINHLEQFTEPLIIFQGAEDKIVPPNQAEMIYQALKKNGIKTELMIYEGEQHGFRKKETIIDSLEKELKFYQALMKPT
jgi:dipeptidyl aminopeptidase/acylaminoacyl peptidase